MSWVTTPVFSRHPVDIVVTQQEVGEPLGHNAEDLTLHTEQGDYPK